MINLESVISYCRDYTKIKNYEIAINDETQTYVCHHLFWKNKKEGIK